MNRDWAQRYVQLGFVVLPLWPGRKRPHASRRRPEQSLLGAGFKLEDVGTSDPATIEDWWGRWPEAGIGIVCGKRSGLYVIDVDQKLDGPDGEHNFIEWEMERWNQGLRLPEAPRVRTPSGGVHLWYRLPMGRWHRGYDGFLPGVDICGSNHWVAAPPTYIADHDRRYQIEHWPASSIPDAPPWLLAEIRDRSTTGRDLTGHATTYSMDYSTTESTVADDPLPATDDLIEYGLRAGSRDRDCYRLACRLWMQHGTEIDAARFEVEAAVRMAWERRHVDPTKDDFTWEDALGKIEYAHTWVRAQRSSIRELARTWLVMNNAGVR